MDILPFPTADAQTSAARLVPDPAQPPGWQRTQAAAIVALAAAEDHLANIGIPRGEAREISRAAIRTFLQQMALSDKPSAPIVTVHLTVEEFLNIVEKVHAMNRGDDAS